MLRVFLSSTFRDLKGERRQLLDNLNQALSDVGMENFIPDGRTSHEISIENLRKSDVVIFLISPYYGTQISECKIEDCKADCPMKTQSGNISYTHCEYKIALSENKPHQVYLVNTDWEIINYLKNKKDIDWRNEFENPIFENYHRDEIEHFHAVADLVSSFRDEAEIEMGQWITGIERITSDLATNIVKWYKEKKIDLTDFCGRRAPLEELFEKMEESVEVYGVGGVGKTSLIQVALLLQKLKGKRIIAIGMRQSYLTGSGYRHFRNKCAEEIYEVIGNRVTLEDLAIALKIQDTILGKDNAETINIILDTINKRNIVLFMDDFHLSDDSIKSLVNRAHCSIVLASKKKIGLARNEIPLLGIEEEDRSDLINLSAKRFHKELDPFAKEKIERVAEGHPVSTEILVRNYERINFKDLENFKRGLNISNPKHSEELLTREIREILNDQAFLLLKRLSLINTELVSNIDANVAKSIQGERSGIVLHELLDTGMLSKKTGLGEFLFFSYKHIQDIIREDKKDHHRWVIRYYQNKPNCEFSIADKIESLFHQSKVKPDNESLNIFFNLCNKIRPSQYGFKRMIEVGRQLEASFRKEKAARAAILVSIANLYSDLNKYNDARKALGEALITYRHLNRQHRFAYKCELATTLNNIGNLCRDLKKYEDADQAHQESLKIRRGLAEKNPDVFGPYLAGSLNNIGNLYMDLKKYEKATDAYQESLKIYRELAEKNPDAIRPDLAMSLNNIGNLYKDLKKYEEAADAYQESLKIYRELAEKNPDAFGPDLAGSLNNIGSLYKDLKKYEEAADAYQESLKIYRELAEKNPDAFGPDLAGSLNNIGSLYTDLKKYEEAADAYQESLKIRRELAEKNPDAIRPDLAMSLNNIGNLYTDLKKYEEAADAYQESLKIRRELAEKNPDAIRPDLANSLNNIGNFYTDLKKYEDAADAYQESLKIRRELAEKNPDAIRPDLANSLNNIGNLYTDLKKYEEAADAYQESLKIRRELAEKNPDAFRSDLSETLNGFAILYRETKKFKDAENYYIEALKIRRELAEKNPDAIRPDLANSLNNIGKLYTDLKKYEEAADAYQESLKIRRELAEKNPDAFISDLAETLNGFAVLYRETKKFEDAENYYIEALKIGRELAKRSFDAFGSDLAETLDGFADFCRKIEKFDEAEKYYQEASEIKMAISKKTKANPK